MTKPGSEKAPWWPFSAMELEVSLAVLGLALTVLSLLELRGEVVAVSGFMGIAWVYLAALLVRAREASKAFEFVEDGGLKGRGYVEPVRRAQASLLLQHVDDDVPSEELRALYRERLEAGVAMRRLVFLRRDSRPESLRWIAEFGDHPNLEHRVILPDQAEVIRSSFVVVDEREVVMSIPGVSVIDGEAYSSATVLRHVVRITDEATAVAFARIHESLWRVATPVREARRFADQRGLGSAAKAGA